MRKTKTQKGITLIALIITIIVLLILAVVAIGAVQNDGIMNHAKNARQEYGAAQDNENTTLQGYLDNIKEHVGTGSDVSIGTDGKDSKDTVTVEKFEFSIGYATYTAEVGMTWSEWVGSSYNNGDFYLSSNNNVHYDREYFNSNTESMYYKQQDLYVKTSEDSEELVLATKDIDSSLTYVWKQHE